MRIGIGGGGGTIDAAVYMAQQAMTTQAATGGRFILGIGLSHQIVIEGILGLSFDKPAHHMREYLEVLMPILEQGTVDHSGEVYRVNNAFGPLERMGTMPPKVVVAALGPVMLTLAGRLTDGTATWMTGPHTIADHIAPTIRKAADEAGRPEPMVIAGVPVSVTDDPSAARAVAEKVFAIYGTLPSYRAHARSRGSGGPREHRAGRR